MSEDLDAPEPTPVLGSTQETETWNRRGARDGRLDQATAERPKPSPHPRGARVVTSILACHLAFGLWAGGLIEPGVLAAGWLARAPSRTCSVDRIFDGDSLRLVCGGEVKEVRLFCIDAPEREQVPWAKQSRRHLREIAVGNLELVERDRDRFGRVVGDLYAFRPERRLLNLVQVEAGQAAVYEHYCSDGRFLRAQRQARKARLGIWSEPGAQQTPWTFRHSHSR